MEEFSFPMRTLTEAHKARQILSQNRIVCRIQRKSTPGSGCGYDIVVMREDSARAEELFRRYRIGRRI